MAAALLSFGALPGEAACPGCGSVSGSVTVEQAFIRTDGTKHDRDVVIMLDPVGSEAPVSDGVRATMDQTGLVFVPHVLAVPRGATVTFLNNDKEQHNVYFLDDRTGDTLDIGTWGPGVSVDHTFDTPGMVITLCKLHLEMASYVVVSPSPWFDAGGIRIFGHTGRFQNRQRSARRLRAVHVAQETQTKRRIRPHRS